MIGMTAIDMAEEGPAAIVTIVEVLENASVLALQIPRRPEKGIPALAAEAPVHWLTNSNSELRIYPILSPQFILLCIW